MPPYTPGRPCEIAVEFNIPDAAVPFTRKHGVESTGPRSVVSRADDWWTAWKQFYF